MNRIAVNTRDDSHVWLRPAEESDTYTFLAWRNDPWIVAKGKTQSTVEEKEHVTWFKNALAEADRLTFVTVIDGEEAGAVFFRRSQGESTISLYLLRPFTGRGHGPCIIRDACQHAFETWPGVNGITAEVLNNNPPSLRAFSRLGFQLTATTAGDTSIFKLPRGSTDPTSSI